MSVEKSPRLEEARALQKEGRFDAARTICEEIIREQGEHADTLHLMGLIAYQTGSAEQAAELIGRATVLDPSNALFHYHCGLAFQTARRFEAAIDSYDNAIAIAPNNVDALLNRGNALAALKQFEPALLSYNEAAALRPNSAVIYYNVGQVLLQLKEFALAAGSFSKAIELEPNYAEAHDRLGFALQKMKRLSDAEQSCRRAIALKPSSAEARYNLGTILASLERKIEAADCYREALALKPELVDAHNNLGAVLLALGATAEACDSFRTLLAANPAHEEAHSNLIYVLDLMASSDVALLQTERKRWCEKFCPPQDETPFFNKPDADRRIRVGYVSADFKMHSAVTAFGAMLTQFNPAEFEVFAYSNLASDGDLVTNMIRDSVTHWRTIAAMSDDDVVAQIRNDGIDILVDLSGHSRGHRLQVFAKKPAPIQISAWGFNTGTGLNAIDVLFGDVIGIPQEERQFYAERVRYLPSTFSAYFPLALPEVNPLPALQGPKLVFGSFNRLCKLSDETLRVWARVLAAVPESMLMIKFVELDDDRQRERVLAAFSAAGVDRQRMILAGGTSWRDHMAAYNRVDVCLDPFPHTGGVTTLEALMMGIPVVTLKWPTLVGRLSASFLTTIGLTDWIAETPDQYVEIAVNKARDLSALNELRQSLRQKLSNSIIGDTKAYAAVVEKEYRHLWREWCAEQKSRVGRKWRFWN